MKGATPRSPSQRCSPRNFNPRSREGSDPSVASTPATKGDFNPRSREGSDQRRSHSSVLRCISIHAPVKGTTEYLLSKWGNPFYFNPRSREGSDGTAPSCRATGRNFNPRSREGSDALQSLHQGVPWISIHAPVKGATTYVAGISNSKTISIHAPVKGATRYFNELTAEKRKISIHAPVKGATKLSHR